ncbi:MAG TPA: cytochrome P450 [Allosphingosinicella sp.]
MLSPAAAPLAWLDAFAASGDAVRRLPGRRLCVADAKAGRAILHNDDRAFVEHSDFFTTRSGIFAPRAAQIAMGRDVRSLLSEGLARADVDTALAELDRRSVWPAAGCRLIAGLSMDLLAGPARDPAFRALLGEIVRVRILDRGVRRPNLLRGLVRKRLFFAAFARERRSFDPDAPRNDALASVFAHGGTANDAQLAEVYLGFVFSLVSSAGLTLAWTVKLAVGAGKTQAPPDRLVSEALRLFPIAWWMARRPAGAFDLLGERVTARDIVIVSPYAIHRNPAYWPEPTQYLPERWGEGADRSAWLPFGAGPHSCIAMRLTFHLLERILGGLFGGLSGGNWTIEDSGGGAMIGAALAPAPFTLIRLPR